LKKKKHAKLMMTLKVNDVILSQTGWIRTMPLARALCSSGVLEKTLSIFGTQILFFSFQ
jgi:hypothetical protein